jgi:hypothetical protein
MANRHLISRSIWPGLEDCTAKRALQLARGAMGRRVRVQLAGGGGKLMVGVFRGSGGGRGGRDERGLCSAQPPTCTRLQFIAGMACST